MQEDAAGMDWNASEQACCSGTFTVAAAEAHAMLLLCWQRGEASTRIPGNT